MEIERRGRNSMIVSLDGTIVAALKARVGSISVDLF